MAFIDDIGSQTQAPPPAPPPQVGSGLRDAIRALFPNDPDAPDAPRSESAAPATSGSLQAAAAQAAKARGVDPALLMALVDSESSWNPNAVSTTGATGIAQFTRGTAAQYGVDRNDPISSLDGAAHYLSDLLRDTHGDQAEAIRRYKGVSVGGATEQNVQDTLAKIPQYRTGYTAPAYTAPAPGQTDGAPDAKPFDLNDPNLFAGTDKYFTPDFGASQTASDGAAGGETPVDQIGGLFGQLVQAQKQKEADDAARAAYLQAHPLAGAHAESENVSLAPPPEIPVPSLIQAANGGPNRVQPVAATTAVRTVTPEGVTAVHDEQSRAQAREAQTELDMSRPESFITGLAERTLGSSEAGRTLLSTLNQASDVFNLESSLNTKEFEQRAKAFEPEGTAGKFTSSVVGGGLKSMIDIALTAIARVPAPLVTSTIAEQIAPVATGREGIGDAMLNAAVADVTNEVFPLVGGLKTPMARILAGGGLGAAGVIVHGVAHMKVPSVRDLAEGAVGMAAFQGASELSPAGLSPEAAGRKLEVDQAAHEAATSPLSDAPPPTPAQKEAGNYKMGHVAVQGLDVTIENPAGSVRSGTAQDGTPWSVTMQDHYGYIKGTKGADGDHVDAFLGPDLTSDKVFVVDQGKRTDEGSFDEHKVILGARTPEEAREIYTRNYDTGEARIQSVSETTMPEFKQWLKDGDTAKPFSIKSEELGVKSEAPTPESQAAPGSRQPIEFADLGNEKQMKVGDSKKPVQYALVEADQVVTSHDPFTFAPDARYPGENQNPYHSDTAQQASVIRGGAETDWDTILNTTGTSTEGPTVIDPYGNAAGGNGRGMMQKRAYQERPEESKAEVVRRAQMFGLDPAKAAQMKEPMIVRVQQEPVSNSIESRRDIAAQNLSVTKSRRPADEGVGLAQRLTPENKSQLAGALENVKSLTEFTDSAEKAKPVIKVLRDAGQITATNQNEYITPDATLTPKGRETVEGMTLGLALPKGDLVERLPDGFRQKLAENLRPLGAVESENGWELHKNLERVLNYTEARQAFVENGSPKEMYGRQTSLLDDADKPPELTDEDKLLLKLLEDPKRTKFKQFMADYAAKAAEARSGEVGFSGEPMTRERAFQEAANVFGGVDATPTKPLAKIIDRLNESKDADDEYIRRSLGKLSAGIDPELMLRVARRGAAKIAEGLSDFAAWSKVMLDEYGPGIREHLKEIFDRSKQQHLLERGEGIGTSVKELRDLYADPPKHSDVKTIVGKYTGARQMLDNKLGMLARDINARFPKSRQEAITNYLQAGGDEGVLRERSDKSETKYKAGYEAALALTPEEKSFAEDARNRLDQVWGDAHDAGILDGYVQNYVRGEWSKAPEDVQREIASKITGNGFISNPGEALKKTFQSYFDGEQAGYTPKDKSIGRQLVAAERSLRMAIEARKALVEMTKAKGVDGRPLVAIGGDGHLVEGADQDPKAPYIVRANAKEPEVRDYKFIDHPALRKWKWVSDVEDSDGSKRPMLLEGNMWVHPEAVSQFKALFGRSAIKAKAKESLPVIGGMRLGAAALKAGRFIKGTILLGPFHQVGLGWHALERLESPVGMAEIDFDKRPLLKDGVEHGLMLVNHNAMAEFGEGVKSSGLLHTVPILGAGLERYQTWLFQDYIPRMMAHAYEVEVPRFEKRYANDLADGSISREQMLDHVAKQVNAAFGEANHEYTGSIFSNKTYRDVLRIGLLAPQFLEARMKFVGQALRPYGAEQRYALLRGAAMMAGAAQTVNYLLNGEMDWSRPFSVIYNGREYGFRTIIQDISHLVTDPRGYFYHRVNPLWGLPLYAAATARDLNGNKIGIEGVATQMLKSWTPMPFQGLWKGYLDGGVANSLINGLMQSTGISNYQYRTNGEKFVFEKSREKMPDNEPTAEELREREARKELRDAYRRKALDPEIKSIIDKYQFGHEAIMRVRRQGQMTPFQSAAERLSAREMAQGFDGPLSDKERDALKPMFLRKLRNADPSQGFMREEKMKYIQKYDLAPMNRQP